jgi:tellurite resistance protein
MADDNEVHSLSAQDALVAVMVAASASDENVTTPELYSISRIVDYLPSFEDYDTDRIKVVSQIVFDLFEEEDGLDALFGLIRDALPKGMYETAYAMACDVVAADLHAREAELRLLQEVRYELNIDRLHAAAIEHAAGVRHKKLPESKG